MTTKPKPKYSVKPPRSVQRERAAASWKPRERLPGECPPRTISVMVGEYDGRGDRPNYIRPGALDFMAMPSRGFAT